MQTITTIGLDIAKSVFQVHGVDNDGKVVIRRQLKRRYVLAFFEKLPPCPGRHRGLCLVTPSAAVLAGGTMSTLGIKMPRWLRSLPRCRTPEHPRRLAQRKDRSRLVAGFSEAKSEEIGKSSGLFSASKPTLIGLTSRATAVVLMQVQSPRRVSVSAATTRFQASALSRVVWAPRSIAR